MVTRNSETHHNSSICTKNKENFQQQSLEINGSREACLEPKLSKDCASPRNIFHGERLDTKQSLQTAAPIADEEESWLYMGDKIFLVQMELNTHRII